MRFLKVIVVLVCCCLFISGTTSPMDEAMNDQLNAHFGFSINPTANSGLITYAIVETDENNKILSRRVISRNNWILQMRGEQYSTANPEGKDLWTEEEIGDCFWILDETMDKYQALNCIGKTTVDDLWRLRYAKNPQYRQDKVTTNGKIIGGWAANAFKPNWPQVQILQKYGIVYISDFFHGEDMYQLLRDVQKDDWVESYRTAK